MVYMKTGDGTAPIEHLERRSAEIPPEGTLVEYDGEPRGLFLASADRLSDGMLQFVVAG